MSKRNTGSFMDKQARQTGAAVVAEPEPFQFGYVRLSAPDGAGLRTIGERVCLACAAKRGVSAETPGWVELYDVPEEARWESCADCTVKFSTLLPLRCPQCGNGDSFWLQVKAWAYLQQHAVPHGAAQLADDWDDLDDPTMQCDRCDFVGA